MQVEKTNLRQYLADRIPFHFVGTKVIEEQGLAQGVTEGIAKPCLAEPDTP